MRPRWLGNLAAFVAGAENHHNIPDQPRTAKKAQTVMADDDFLLQRDRTDGAVPGPVGHPCKSTPEPFQAAVAQSAPVQRIDAALGRAPTTMASRKPRESDNEDGWPATNLALGALTTADGFRPCDPHHACPGLGSNSRTTHLKLDPVSGLRWFVFSIRESDS